MKRIHFLFVLLLFFSFLGCQKLDLPESVPACIKRKIRQVSPVKVLQYQYNQQTVYLFSPDCCDRFEELYDSNCNLICRPSGGFTGKGDGTCPDFYGAASEGILIWEASK